MMNKKKGGLAKRYASSYETKESGAPKKAGVMNWKKCENDISFFSPTEGKNRINIIPYTIKTKNHPLVKKGEFDVGEKDYVMDVFVHRGVGPSEASVLCLKSTFGKPCPICEQAQAFRKQGKEEEASNLKASRRVFYNVEDLKESGKIKVFETSHYLFEKELIDEARDDEEGGFVDFADPEEGKEIKFRSTKVKKGNFEFNEYKSFSFEDRDEPVSEELLESAISFDELLNIPTYEEAEKILYGKEDEESSEKDDDEEEQEEKPKKKSKPVEEDEDEEEEKTVKKSSKKQEEDEETDEDDEDVFLKESKKKPVKKEEDDEEEQEEKPSKKSCSEDCGKCPFGHKFGKDTDEYEECDDCEVWDKCIKGNK